MSNFWDNENLIQVLKNGGVVVMPTDTLYGIVGQALNRETFTKLYQIRQRPEKKPSIVLIGDMKELDKFSVHLSLKQRLDIERHWAGPDAVSVVLDCPNEKFEYLHCGTKTIAFRLPVNQNLRALLLKVGPLIAPSANLEGQPPASNIEQARDYFGDNIDVYINGGEIKGKSSKLISLSGGGPLQVLRP